MTKVLSKNYTVDFKQYGKITVPKGTRTTHQTAMGIDRSYNFVDEYDWIDKDYPAYSNILKMDVESYGINVPEEYLEKINKKV
jgi:hypothetical protein